MKHWTFHDCTPEVTNNKHVGLRFEVVEHCVDESFGDAFERRICQTFDGGQSSKDDAQLIAAAPDLLAACRQVADFLESIEMGTPGKLLPAIAKAEGGE